VERTRFEWEAKLPEARKMLPLCFFLKKSIPNYFRGPRESFRKKELWGKKV